LRSHDNSEQPIHIRINSRDFRLTANRLAGRDLRSLASLGNPEVEDLYLERAGLSEDRLILDDEVLELEEGMHLFSTPRLILMGLSAKPT
jgi:hypothetical protein